MNVNVASFEWAAGRSAAWIRCVNEDGLQLTGAPEGKSFSATRPIPGGISLSQTYPLALFPKWEIGNDSPQVTLKVERTDDGSFHKRNFFGIRTATLPAIYRLDKIATFAIRIFPAYPTTAS